MRWSNQEGLLGFTGVWTFEHLDIWIFGYLYPFASKPVAQV